jgi:hypothetical protein
VSGPSGLAAFLAARLDEAAQNISYAGPARIAWLSVNDDQGKFRYTTVAAGDDNSPWCADGRELPEPTSVRVVWDPAANSAPSPPSAPSSPSTRLPAMAGT